MWYIYITQAKLIQIKRVISNNDDDTDNNYDTGAICEIPSCFRHCAKAFHFYLRLYNNSCLYGRFANWGNEV